MTILLGAAGYIGKAFANELQRRDQPFTALARKAIDYTRFDVFFDYVRKVKPSFIINAAGYMGKPDVDACESARADAVQGNTLFPQTVARVCFMTNTPWAHVSSGSIYSGAKVVENGSRHIERDLGQLHLRQLFANHPERFFGFTEMDEPNFSFRNPPCNFYSGTKAMAEEVLRPFERTYIWRMRLPFDEVDHPRNFLTRIQHYDRVHLGINSLSHLGDCVRACLDLKEMQAPFGIYNVVNPGAVANSQIVDMIRRILSPSRPFYFWRDEEDFYQAGVKAPRSSCILDASKVLKAGASLRPVRQSLEDSLKRWQPQARGVPANILPFPPNGEWGFSLQQRA
jgi:UDP-glucose 4,6-dehydratase